MRILEFAAHFRTDVWYQIGLYRPSDSASYAWTDGSALEYTNWYPGWAFNTPKYDCVVLWVDSSDPNNAKWANWYCDNESYIWYGLCEKEPR